MDSGYSTFLVVILENFRRYAPFFSSFVQKRVLFGKICQKNSVFTPKKMQEKGCLFREFRMRKGMGSEAVLAHPSTKIREETPPPPGKCPCVPPGVGLVCK